MSRCALCRAGLRDLARDAAGSLAVEMAILLPLLFALLFAAIDIGRLLLTRSLLDQLAVALADEVRREVPLDARPNLTAAMLDARLGDLAPQVSGGFLRPESLSLVIDGYDSFAALATGDAAGGAVPGRAAAIVGYRLTYDMLLLTPFADYIYPSGNARETAYVIVKNGL